MGLPALDAGLAFAPYAVGFSVASVGSGRLVPRFGRHVLTGGTAGMTVGALMIAETVTHGHRLLGDGWLTPALALSGAGQGLVLAPMSNIVLRNIRHGDADSAAGVLSTVQQVAGALGIALLGLLFFASTAGPGDAGGAAKTVAFAAAFAVTNLCRAGLSLALIPLVFLLPRD